MDDDRIWNLMAKKLSGEASPAEIRELETQLRLNPDMHYSLEALHDMWKKKSRPEPEQAEEAFRRHLERMQILGIDMGESEETEKRSGFRVPVHKRIFWKTLAFMLSSFLLFTLGYYFFNTRTPAAIAQKPVWEVVTRNGTRTNLQLPDGSTVWLNAGSRLTYDSLYGNNLREVTLSGEAYFDVVKNPSKPFIIHTGKINIKVLGTVFNVKSYPGEKTIETSLIRGSIEVTFPSLPAKKIILSPNQKLVINKTEAGANVSVPQLFKKPAPMISIQHLSRIGSDSAIAETGWMRNRLYFNDMSFHDLLKNMERKYGVTFQLADSSMDNIHFTGSFQNETVTQALEALRLTAEKSTTDFSYSLRGNQVYIFSKLSEDPSNQTK